MKHVFLLSIIVCFQTVQAAEQNPTDRAIREQIMGFGGADVEANYISNKLAQFPREKVISVIRNEIASEIKPQHLYLKAAAAIGALELGPQFKFLAQKSDAWTVFATLNKIYVNKADAAKIGLEEIYLKRLVDAPVPAKMALLAGLGRWQTPVDKDTYRDFTSSSSYELRQAVVMNFVQTKKSLPLLEQINRYQTALKLKPYRVRLIAMDSLLDLPASERDELSAAVPQDLCVSEKHLSVKPSCARLIASVKAKSSAPVKKGGTK